MLLRRGTTFVSLVLASKIPKRKRPFKTYLRKSVVNSFFINPVQESEIEKLINNFNQNKSLGPCTIPVKILQKHVDVFKHSLTYLINLSFQQGIFPEALKRRSSISFCLSSHLCSVSF